MATLDREALLALVDEMSICFLAMHLAHENDGSKVINKMAQDFASARDRAREMLKPLN